MRYQPSEVSLAHGNVAAAERAADRQRNARRSQPAPAACSNKQHDVAAVPQSPDGGPCSSAAARAPQFCVVLQAQCPSVAHTADIVRMCSEQQGGGACLVMVVQADGQVVVFSVASVEALVPLQKSARAAPRVFEIICSTLVRNSARCRRSETPRRVRSSAEERQG